MTQLKRTILYFGKTCVLACDGRCEKAWGINNRPREELDPDDPDNFAWLADHELDAAPDDPGTYEGGHAKPAPDEKLESKWCARECERSVVVDPGEDIALRDFSQRYYNRKPHTRGTLPTAEVPAPKAGEPATDGLDFDPQVGQPVNWREQPGTVLEVRGCSTYLIAVAGEKHLVDYVELSAPVSGPSEVTEPSKNGGAW